MLQRMGGLTHCGGGRHGGGGEDKEMSQEGDERGGAGGRQWLLTFANDTNTIVRKQLQVGFIGNMLANSDDLDHLYLHVL